MAVTSVRLNKREEIILDYLKKHYRTDASTILKRSLYDLYEDIMDSGIIDEFEKKKSSGKIKFVRYEDLFK
jgi:hypothetical protein